MTSTCKLDKTKKYRQGDQISQFNNFISILISLLVGRFLVLDYFPPFLSIQPYILFLDYGPRAQKLGYDLSDMMGMVLFRRWNWKVLICVNPSADFLIISKLPKPSSEDLVPLSELESTYNGSPRGKKNLHSQEMNITLVVRAGKT